MDEINEKVYLIIGEINARKQLLADTDYICLKHSDGVLSDDDYAETKAKRATWRAEINEYEIELVEAEKEAAAIAETQTTAEDETDAMG